MIIRESSYVLYIYVFMPLMEFVLYINMYIEKRNCDGLLLPPYSPNLNLIERLWKMLRKKVINTRFYRTKEEFRRAVMNFFEHIADYKEELESLLTLNFDWLIPKPFRCDYKKRHSNRDLVLNAKDLYIEITFIRKFTLTKTFKIDVNNKLSFMGGLR